ncbi:MAG: 5'-methylthioadenosine/adenosylhomocysteine nucleosidase [Ruminococcaceae bacterium]|nr:5'-methylthioadenosine/adenosylhomocysteine nucleosidase [Oscillospiraceae bacterium]
MIGIICALSIEVEGLTKLLKNKKEETFAKMKYISGTINDKEVVMTECGIGKVNAAMSTQIMIDKYNVDVIINSGIAGSVSQELKIGDIVISKDCVQHDFDGTQMGDPKGLIQYNDETRIDIPVSEEIAKKLFDACKDIKDTNVLLGRIATGDIFVAQREMRQSVADEFSALACEMEGGAVAQVCYRNDIPCAVLRCISDDFLENQFMDFMEFRVLAADKSMVAIKNFLELV